MNVVYDLLGFQSRDHGERGIARYVLNLALALERTNPGLVTEYRVHPDLPFPTGLEPLVGTGRLQLADRRTVGTPSSSGGVFIAGSPFENYNQPSELVLPSFVRSNQWRRLVVLHDLIPAIFPELYLDNEPNRRWYGARLASLNLFDRFLANSQATADDAVAMLDVTGDQMTVIGAGADDQFQRPAEGHRAAAQSLVQSGAINGLRPGYILFPTGIDPRKNIERTIHAYGRLPRRVRRTHQLVLACRLSEGDRAIVRAMAEAAGVGDELVVTGYVSDRTLCRLYQGAHLVVFPSYYEGFGLPALEAMRCGAPVICADASSLTEVQPLEHARFDPLSVRSIAAALTQALADDHLRDELRNQTPPPFTWDNAARGTGEVIRQCLDQLRTSIATVDPRGSTGAKPRLALFAPLPPQQTGVANYTYRLIEELRHHCDVTVFVDCGPGDRKRRDERRGDRELVDLRDSELAETGRPGPDDLRRPDGVTVVGTDQFDAVAAGGGAFDQVLYFLGNTHHHIQALQANKERKGHVLLHDVRLTELYRAIRNDIPDRLVDGSVGRTIGAFYPDRYRAEVEAMDVVNPETAHRFGILLARGIADEDTELMVHSATAKTLLRLDGAGEASIPFPAPCPTFPQPWSPPDGPPLIGVFGPLDPVRLPDRVVVAMATVVQTVPDARLRFVGRIEGLAKERLITLATRWGIADRVDFKGGLTDEEFRQEQRDTTLAVQLRSATDGGASSTVTELIGLGVPTLASDIDWVSEMPDEVVAKVAPSIDGPGLGDVMTSMLLDGAGLRQRSLTCREYAAHNSFARAAELLADRLFTRADRRPGDRSASNLAAVSANQERSNVDLGVVQRGVSAYLGDSILVTRLENGQDIYVDGRDTSVAPALLLDGRWEPETTDVFTALLRPGDCVIDIGANFGYFGLLAGAVVTAEAGGSVHMMEPNPHLVSLIERSIACNGLADRATVWGVAVSDGPGQIQLRIPKHLWGSAHVGGLDDGMKRALDRAMAQSASEEDAVVVPTIDLDRFTEQHDIDRVDVVKVDIEGHEQQAYRGMADVISRNRGTMRMLIEFTGNQYEEPADFFGQILNDFGTVAVVQPESGHLIPVAHYDDVRALSQSGFTMLLAGTPQGQRQLSIRPVPTQRPRATSQPKRTVRA